MSLVDDLSIHSLGKIEIKAKNESYIILKEVTISQIKLVNHRYKNLRPWSNSPPLVYMTTCCP